MKVTGILCIWSIIEEYLNHENFSLENCCGTGNPENVKKEEDFESLTTLDNSRDTFSSCQTFCVTLGALFPPPLGRNQYQLLQNGTSLDVWLWLCGSENWSVIEPISTPIVSREIFHNFPSVQSFCHNFFRSIFFCRSVANQIGSERNPSGCVASWRCPLISGDIHGHRRRPFKLSHSSKKNPVKYRNDVDLHKNFKKYGLWVFIFGLVILENNSMQSIKIRGFIKLGHNLAIPGHSWK